MVGAIVTGQGLVATVHLRRDPFELDVELSVAPGTTAALLGPNGSGKSTLVDALAGVVPVDRGRIELAGRVLDDAVGSVFVPPESRRIGVVFQRYLLFDHLTVLDNVAFGLHAAGRSRRDARIAAEPWIEALDLADLAQRRPARLSGGQAQRVAVARALATEPDALLLDEPLAAVDVETRTRLRRLLAAHLADFDGPRLLITHDPADAFLLAERVHIIEAGRITQSGTPEHLRRHPATPYAAALAGVNLLSGTIAGGVVRLDDHPHSLVSADRHTTGPVLVAIHPSAVALHAERPHGSPRNSWETTIGTIEPLGETTRIVLGRPLPLSVDVTPAAVESLALAPGRSVWASVKATELSVSPAS